MDIIQNKSFSDKWLQSLEINILSGDWRVYDSTWGGKRINDPFARLYWIKKGHGVVRFKYGKQKIVSLQPGRLFLFPPNWTADYSCDGGMELMWVHLTLRISRILDVFSLWTMPLEVLISKYRHEISRLFSALLSVLSSEEEDDWLRADGAARYLLSFLFADALGCDKTASEKVERLHPIMLFMQSHLHEPLQLEDMAERMQLHPTYFSNLFSQTLGISPMQYLKNLRIKTAQELLRFTSLPIYEVAAQTGYTDSLYFSRCFKQKIGISPTQYRAIDNRF